MACHSSSAVMQYSFNGIAKATLSVRTHLSGRPALTKCAIASDWLQYVTSRNVCQFRPLRCILRNDPSCGIRKKVERSYPVAESRCDDRTPSCEGFSSFIRSPFSGVGLQPALFQSTPSADGTHQIGERRKALCHRSVNKAMSCLMTLRSNIGADTSSGTLSQLTFPRDVNSLRLRPVTQECPLPPLSDRTMDM
jgi:hypothetical protein